MAVLDYIEFPVRSVAGESGFYSKAFGWDFTSYGPDYAAYEKAPCQLGLNGTDDQRPATILPVIRVEDIEAALRAVVGAGGKVTVDIFAFPGGRRFHFTDPEGLELAAYQPG